MLVKILQTNIGSCLLKQMQLRSNKAMALSRAASYKYLENFQNKRSIHTHGTFRSHKKDYGNSNQNRGGDSFIRYGMSVIAIGVSGLVLKMYCDSNTSECATNTLPEFSREEVSKKTSKANGIWVIYNNNVYNITEFVDNHPGGSSKIMLAAGNNLEPFWDMYAIHKKDEVLEILQEYQIGVLCKEDRVVAKKTKGPFANDPKRHPALLANSTEPYNGETPSILATDSLITPNELFFVRNHLPVPDLNEKDSKLIIEGTDRCISLNIDELKNKFPKIQFVAALQCAGNRRSEMNPIKKVKGLSWSHNAISNAKWGGVLLRDVLIAAGVDPNDKNVKHIHFEGADKGPTGAPYGASIPANRIFGKNLPVLIVYEMNDQQLPRDHGYPLRIVAPGIVGARNVKWLQKIIVSDKEYSGHWQQNDYKPFSPNIDWDNVDFSKAPAIQELPVTSAICYPTDNTIIHESEEEISVKGYAYSGGGKGIVRVDVSIDEGKTWITSELQQTTDDLDNMYSWTLWQCNIPIPENHKGKLNILCKAIDSSCNTQPDTVAPVWNLRGCLNNAWHRIDVVIDDSE